MIWWAAIALFQQTIALDIPSKNPNTSEADVAAGKKLFNGRCAGCHGPAGEGGKGANLAVPRLTRAQEDRALYRVIRYGVPDTEMPASLMDAHEIWQVAAFVRTLGRVQSVAVTGDAANGASLFKGKGGCIGCHTVGLEGGRSGPALSGVGARRGAQHLRAKLLDPSASVPENFRMVHITTRDGKTIRGQQLNEDTFSIQLRDGADRFHSLWREDIAAITSERKTPMPSYKGRLSDSEIDDVVAYMASLRGDQ